MPSKAKSRANVSDIMRRVKSRDTSPELLLGRELRRRGLRFRSQVESLPGKPDLVVKSKKLIIFVDGDFWHGNQWRQRGHLSLREQLAGLHNEDYWVHKINRNMMRDQKALYDLTCAGWHILRFWESDIQRDVAACADVVIQAIENAETARPLPIVGLTFAEFFAGIGLVRLGLERAGWHVRFANDNDPDKVEMYQANFPDAHKHLVGGDVNKLHVDAVPTVTLATGSFPCNDLSLAGAMKGLNGHQSGAFWGFHRILKEQGARRPPIILIENVMGLIYSNHGDDLATLVKALNELGYICDAFVVDAAHFVPQSRPRLFIVGIQTQDRNESSSTIVTTQSEQRPKKLAQFILEHQELKWNIRLLPELPTRTLRLEDIIEALPEKAPEWWSQERVEYLRNQMSPKHGAIADAMMQRKIETYGAVFRRVRNGKSMAEMRVDGLAGALRTPRGGSGRQILFAAGKGRRRARLFTPRECARLMGADDFVVNVPLNQALFGFGDAVCVPVIEWIAANYLNPVVNELAHNHLIMDTHSNLEGNLGYEK